MENLSHDQLRYACNTTLAKLCSFCLYKTAPNYWASTKPYCAWLRSIDRLPFIFDVSLCTWKCLCLECFFKDACMCIKLLPPIEPFVSPIMHGWCWSPHSHLYWCVIVYIEVSVFECFLKDACICMIDHTHNPNHDLWGSLISRKLSCPLSVYDYHHYSSAVYSFIFMMS